MAFEIPRYPDGVFYLFRKLVNEPYRNHEETDAWIDEVLETDSEYHRREILKQGRANFSENLDKVLVAILIVCLVLQTQLFL